MVIYKVIIHIQKEIEPDWLSWMKKEHVPEIMSLNIFMKSKIFQILHPKKHDLKSYCIEYHCNSINDYDKYKNNYAKSIQKKHSEKYKGQFNAKRLIISLKNEF